MFNFFYIYITIFTKEKRLSLLQSIYDGLCEGGAFIISEKVYIENSMLQDIYTFSYYDYKKNSFTEKEILDKEKDLRKILKPNFSSKNIDMLYKVGFKTIGLFYKYFMFEGYICIKGGD